jgi:hypothetical protein
MPHSAVYKAVYIHIPKNAGTSIENWMCIDKKKFHRQVNGLEIDHLTAELYQSQWSTVFQSFYKFTIVRNPFDRMVSEFLHKKRYRDTRFIDVTNMTFEEFILALREKFFLMGYKKHVEISHFLPQHQYTHSKEGQQLVDYIGRFENLNEEIERIGKRLGINKPFIKVDQFSADYRLAYQKYYTNKSVEIVAKLYQRDFEIFGYPSTIKLEPIRLVHLVNPYYKREELFRQVSTMKSLVKAQSMVKSRDRVELTACYLTRDYSEMKSFVPAGFKRLFISKTVNDYVDLGLSQTRPLPLLGDIFDCLYSHTTGDTDVFIYSNMDIMVTEDFYQKVFNLLRSGSGHFCLNRSTIPQSHHELDPDRDAQALKRLAVSGTPHPGYDCFVFYRSKTPSIRLNQSILGYTPIGEFLKNQLARSHWSFRVFEKENLTFHFGNDMPHYQKSVVNLIYTLHNFQQTGMISEFKSHCQRIFGLNLDQSHLDLVHQNVCKLNLSLVNQQNHQHCQGWNTIVDYMRSRLIHNDRGIHFIDFFDKDINRPLVMDVCYRSPWVGFIHMAPGNGLPGESSTLGNLFGQLEQRDVFRKLFGNCRGIFVLSDHLKRFLDAYLVERGFTIAVEVFCHPKEIPLQYNLKEFMAKKKRKLLHVGRYLRNIDSFSRLKVPSNYHKQLLNNSLNNREYLGLLASNVVFADFYDASASNLVVECIVGEVPILVNPIPPVVEYLGEGYPLYYRSLEEASSKISNDHYIVLAHHYLKGLNRDIYTMKFFYGQFIRSPLLSQLPAPPFPVQQQQQPQLQMTVARPVGLTSTVRRAITGLAGPAMFMPNRSSRRMGINLSGLARSLFAGSRLPARTLARMSGTVYRTSTNRPIVALPSETLSRAIIRRQRPGLTGRRGYQPTAINRAYQAQNDEQDARSNRGVKTGGTNRLLAQTLIGMALVPAVPMSSIPRPNRNRGAVRRPRLPMLSYSGMGRLDVM